jgi:hypothetical protein
VLGRLTVAAVLLERREERLGVGFVFRGGGLRVGIARQQRA